MDMVKINLIVMDWIMMGNGLMINHKEMESLGIKIILKLLECLKMEILLKIIKLLWNIKMEIYIKDIFKIYCHMEKGLLLINKENLKWEYSKMENLFNS